MAKQKCQFSLDGEMIDDLLNSGYNKMTGRVGIVNAGKEPPIFYYRDKDQKEIDLLLYQNGVLSPIEIKKSASPGKTAIKNFKVLDPVTRGDVFDGLESLKVEIGTGSVVCMANDLLPVDEKNWYVPAWLI